MNITTVGILSPGDMGGKVGGALRSQGFEVLTYLGGRSVRTTTLAKQAGIKETSSMNELVEKCDIILSILVPSKSVEVAESVAKAIIETQNDLYFVDCNAVSPSTVCNIGNIISNAGGKFIDVGIIGAPPGHDVPRFYASGEHASVLQALQGKSGTGIAVRDIGGEIGKASAVKMCYASVTKGTAALFTLALTTAEVMDVYTAFTQELEYSQKSILQRMESVSSLSAKAFRWVGEMEEISKTFESAGVSRLAHLGAAEAFDMVATSPIGNERPETIDKTRTLKQTIDVFANHVNKKHI